MSPKTFVVAAALAVVSLVAAVVAAALQPTVSVAVQSHAPAFPTLRERLDAAARVEVVKGGGESFALVKGADGVWRAADHHDYPVKPEEIRALLLTLSDMRLVEAKTERPELHDRLRVEDVTGKEAKSHLVRVKDDTGTVLAEAIIGRQSSRIAGPVRDGTYIRRPSEARAWLASGGLWVRDRVVEWLDGKIVDLPREEVKRIAVQREGDRFVVARGAKEGKLALASVPEGRKAKQEEVDRMESAASNVNLMEVQPAAGFAWPEQKASAVVSTFSGLDIRFELSPLEDGAWASVRAEAGDGASAEAKARAEAINARTGGWVYKISKFDLDRMAPKLEAVLEKPPGTS